MREGKPDKEIKLYKFKELKVYSSTEWLADNKKKYRQVFDRYGTTYVYAELSFYNKNFDETVWEVNVSLKCYELTKNRKKVCSLDFKRKVSKFDSVVFIREGWGNKKEGSFWKKGTYYWEAWIEDTKVATKYFYVEETKDRFLKGNNQYIELKNLKLYEGQYDDVIEEDRTYLRTFSNETTRYVYAEIDLKNLHITQNWHCELFVKFYNEAKELKGQVTKLQNVKAGDDTIKISAGWGSNVKGSWREGDYSIDIIFMEILLATVHFRVEEESEEGMAIVKIGHTDDVLHLQTENDLNKTFPELLEKLENLIGLNEIKQKVKDHASYIQFLQLRKDKGFEENDKINIHSVFMGNPGTGKTTVAKMMGSLYKKMGLLSKGHVHEVDRVDLVGEYIGQTAPKVKAAIEKSRGGVLFIDEAYALARTNDDTKDFGREVIEILVKEMSNGKGDMAVIVAGYPKEMKHFIDSNPGLKSRFKHFYDFADYLPQELSLIANNASEEMEVVLSDDARVAIDEIIVSSYRERDKSFGNARFVYDLIEKAKINLGLRIMKQKGRDKLSHQALENIILEDVQAINLRRTKALPNIPIDEQLLTDAIHELEELVGIETVKKEIRETVEIVRYHKLQGKNVLNSFHFHTVFIGNPGTGKTTVARILCKIYKALGILERGHMVETDRQGLVAGFVGQTAMKTMERIEEAMGGVLFIDEAYALSNFNGLQGDYGNEAIQTILKRMEDNRGEFFVFAAGYPENMDRFLKANPGLSSRFDKTLSFEDYTVSELREIALFMYSERGYQPTKTAVKALEEIFTDVFASKNKFFGNAREVRKIVSESIKYQNLRISKLENKVGTRTKSITKEDIYQVEILDEQKVFKKQSIGYRNSGH